MGAGLVANTNPLWRTPLALASRQTRHEEELTNALGAEPIERADLDERHTAQVCLVHVVRALGARLAARVHGHPAHTMLQMCSGAGGA